MVRDLQDEIVELESITEPTKVVVRKEHNMLVGK